MTEPLRIFLDANILFSAAYKKESTFLAFWKTAGLVPMTSFYAAQEALRNCQGKEQLERLEALLAQTVLVSDAAALVLPLHFPLPAKDQPILAAAINAGAAFLITGDKAHFAVLMEKPIETRNGVLVVLPPGPFLDWLRERPQPADPLQ